MISDEVSRNSRYLTHLMRGRTAGKVDRDTHESQGDKHLQANPLHLIASTDSSYKKKGENCPNSDDRNMSQNEMDMRPIHGSSSLAARHAIPHSRQAHLFESNP